MKKEHKIEIIFSADLFQSMESLHTLNLGNNLIEEFSMPLITEWFTAESSADDVQEPKETKKSSNFSLILNENPVSTEIYPSDGKLHNLVNRKIQLSHDFVQYLDDNKWNGLEFDRWLSNRCS